MVSLILRVDCIAMAYLVLSTRKYSSLTRFFVDVLFRRQQIGFMVLSTHRYLDWYLWYYLHIDIWIFALVDVLFRRQQIGFMVLSTHRYLRGGPHGRGLHEGSMGDLQPAACNLRPAACGMRPATCGLPRSGKLDLRPAACGLQPAACNLQPAACSLQPAACNLRSATCGLRHA